MKIFRQTRGSGMGMDASPFFRGSVPSSGRRPRPEKTEAFPSKRPESLPYAGYFPFIPENLSHPLDNGSPVWYNV